MGDRSVMYSGVRDSHLVPGPNPFPFPSPTPSLIQTVACNMSGPNIHTPDLLATVA